MAAVRVSAGLLMYRFASNHALEVFLVHPGGPFWRSKDKGAWMIPKGQLCPDEELLAAARREWQEETGFPSNGPFIELTPIRQKSGKLVHAWAFEGDCDPAKLCSNTVPIEWPPHSGKTTDYPEVDRGAWFGVEGARLKMLPSQLPLVEELVAKLKP